MSANYVLLPAAESDLRSIIQYTRRRWGEAQARTYAAQLQRGIESMADGRDVSRDVTGLYPGLRMLRCGRHYVFCLPRQNAPLAVVAIFHERMDLMVRVSDRLGASQTLHPDGGRGRD